MNEQLQATVNEILQKSISAFEQGAEWMAGEVPDVLEQLLTWHLFKSVFLMIISLVIIGISVATVKNIYKNRSDGNHWAWEQRSWGMSISTTGGLANALSVLFIAAFGVSFVADSLVALQILVAPKLYLLEYAAKLVS